MHILTLNMGSSSLKFSLHDLDGGEALRADGLLDGIGQPAGRVTISDGNGEPLLDRPQPLPDARQALHTLLAWLTEKRELERIDGVGHRVVHGGPRHAAPARIGPTLVAELRGLALLAPLHMPPEIEAIEEWLRLLPGVPQVACFDTAFHRSIPEVARTYALPRRFRDAGVQRFGFHGLSYEYILEELATEAGRQSANGRLIVAHLGNGASMAAISGGKCVDTTMGFTPTGGLVMGTRPGDLDPGILTWLLSQARVSPTDLAKLLQHESGLFGLSGGTSDMRTLQRPDASPEAKLAVAVFCHVARKHVGALAATLGGLDTLVFTAGIGEHSPEVRREICRGLAFLGIELDEARNRANAAVISTGRVTVRVMKTNEERMIARHTARALEAK
ncbi:MAG: acetate/propionate family kinase [Gemmataceae bacterium]